MMYKELHNTVMIEQHEPLKEPVDELLKGLVLNNLTV